MGREDEARLEARRHATLYLSVFPNDEGMYELRGRLDPEVGALWMRAIEAASDALYRGSLPETTPEQRRADALALIAERVLAVGFGWADAQDARGTSRGSDERDTLTDPMKNNASAESSAKNRADAEDLGASAESSPAGAHPVAPPESSEPGQAKRAADSAEARQHGSGVVPRGAWKSERYMVVLHVDAATLADGAEPGRSELEDGTRVSAESARRLACDASVVRVVHGRNERDTHVEGRTRTVPLRLRRALEIRDRGCRFPGCGSRYTDAHHIRHWADGGATRLDNLILLCGAHHRLLHEGGFGLEPNPDRPDRPTFVSPRGVRIPEVPPKMTLNGGLLGVGAQARSGRADPASWERDVPLSLYLRALESLA